MTNKAADILRKAKELIETRGWTKGTYARDSLGEHVPYTSCEATSFCAEGALLLSAYRYAPHTSIGDLEHLLERAAGLRTRTVAAWNDTKKRTKAEVLSAFDRAIALAEAGNDA